MTAPLAPEERDTLRDLDAKRTQGEWSTEPKTNAIVADDGWIIGFIGAAGSNNDRPRYDASYIVAACNALPRALAQIESLEADRDAFCSGEAYQKRLVRDAWSIVHSERAAYDARSEERVKERERGDKEKDAEIERLKAELQAMGARAADAKWDLTP